MTLVSLAASLVLVVIGMVALAGVTIVRRDRLARFRAEYRERTRAIAPYLVLLGAVLVVNVLTRQIAPEVSWLIGWNITGHIYAIEGSFVAGVQSAVPSLFSPYFSFMYVYGYIFLLVFPLLGYLALETLAFARETCLAYMFNYGIGLLFYLLFVAYGPRNLMPDMVEPLLYTNWPASHLFTSEVNVNTNVFPSLHSSLSITAALIAYRSRAYYPAWTVIAVIFAASIVLSTMYLGIHWLLDVVAGGGLAVIAVWGAARVEASRADYRVRLAESRLGRRLGRYRRAIGTVVDSRRGPG